MQATEPAYMAVIGIYPLKGESSAKNIPDPMHSNNKLYNTLEPSPLEKSLPIDDMMKDIYQKASQMPGYSNGPAYDSNLGVLSRILADQAITAMREYQNAQRLINMGMKSN